jgi:hypothetical protein
MRGSHDARYGAGNWLPGKRQLLSVIGLQLQRKRERNTEQKEARIKIIKYKRKRDYIKRNVE